MKSNSLVLLITWSAACIISLGIFWKIHKEADESYANEIQIRDHSVTEFFNKNANVVLADPQQMYLFYTKLRALRESRQIHFFVIKKDGLVVTKEFPESKPQDHEFPFVAGPELVSLSLPGQKPFGYYRGYDYAGYLVAVGFYWSEQAYHEAVWSYYLKDNVFLTLFLIIGVFGAALYNLARLLRLLKMGADVQISESDLSPNNLKSDEEKKLFMVLNAHESVNKEQKIHAELLAQNLPQSVLAEIKSGLKPPYEFEGTLVRLDVNHLSTLRLKLTPEKTSLLDQYLDRLMIRCQGICQKYGGYAHEVIWDEFICYFKDIPESPSSLQALFFVREVFQEIPKLSQDCENHIGIPLILKAACDTGTFHVRKTLDPRTIKINAECFISSVRLLSLVETKDRNSLWLTKTVADEVQGVVSFESLGTRQLRGVKEPVEVVDVKDWLPLESVLEQKDAWGWIYFYRSVQDLRKILDFMDRNFEAVTEGDFVDLLKSFSQYSYAISDISVITSYQKLLVHCSEKSRGDEDVRLPSLVTVAGKLFSKKALEQVSPDLVKLISSGGRVGANVLELLPSAVDSIEADVSLFSTTINNRKIGNICVQRCRKSLSKGVMKDLIAMVNAQDPKFLASGLWALRKINDHFLATNPVYINSHEEFQDLVREGLLRRNVADEAVQRQATQLSQSLQKASASRTAAG